MLHIVDLLNPQSSSEALLLLFLFDTWGNQGTKTVSALPKVTWPASGRQNQGVDVVILALESMFVITTRNANCSFALDVTVM